MKQILGVPDGAPSFRSGKWHLDGEEVARRGAGDHSGEGKAVTMTEVRHIARHSACSNSVTLLRSRTAAGSSGD